MDYNTLMSYIQHFGYAALFFALWLGIVGMPIPDEVVVMTGGAVTASGLLHTLPAFILTYLGVVSGLSLGYALGRWFGLSVLDRLRRKEKMRKYIDFSEKLVHKYGSFALVISYFFPIIRHIMPYMVGLNKMAVWRYALISFTTGLVWTAIVFTTGHFAFDHVQELGELIYHLGIKLLWIPLALGGLYFGIRYARISKNRKGGDKL
ncbi:DedA family protein [Paenibacillus azoreducens]|uniref:DedA family protein n=1 Tax=Paenibacillus azoreducens TaxID=116718 RepID=UPI0039F4923E